MKFRPFSLLLFIGLILLLGCTNRDLLQRDRAEIDAYIAQNPDLSSIDIRCLQQGVFEIGIHQETVRFLLGEPNSVEMVRQPWAMQEHWSYRRGSRKVFIIEDRHVVGISE